MFAVFFWAHWIGEMKTLEHDVSVSSCRFKLGDFVVNDDKMTHKTHVLALFLLIYFSLCHLKGTCLNLKRLVCGSTIIVKWVSVR